MPKADPEPFHRARGGLAGGLEGRRPALGYKRDHQLPDLGPRVSAVDFEWFPRWISMSGVRRTPRGGEEGAARGLPSGARHSMSMLGAEN